MNLDISDKLTSDDSIRKQKQNKIIKQ